MQLARTWAQIAHYIDGRIDTLAKEKLLVWMPAHQSAKAIGNKLKSNAIPITSIEWRSDNLVDDMAKLAARKGAASEDATKLLESAEALVKHVAAQLGVAIHSANDFKEVVVLASGESVTRSRRDAQQPTTRKLAKCLKPVKKRQAT